MATRVESEAARIARVPGIEFVDGGAGRRARIAGSGVAVFEIAHTYLAADGDMAIVRHVYDWLSQDQIAAALDYWRAYPDEIESRIARDESCMGDL